MGDKLTFKQKTKLIGNPHYARVEIVEVDEDEPSEPIFPIREVEGRLLNGTFYASDSDVTYNITKDITPKRMDMRVWFYGEEGRMTIPLKGETLLKGTTLTITFPDGKMFDIA